MGVAPVEGESLFARPDVRAQRGSDHACAKPYGHNRVHQLPHMARTKGCYPDGERDDGTNNRKIIAMLEVELEHDHTAFENLAPEIPEYGECQQRATSAPVECEAEDQQEGREKEWRGKRTEHPGRKRKIVVVKSVNPEPR